MTGFQHVGVLDARGPHVTPMAGVHLGGRYWATTAASAAKVRAARAGSPVAVLDEHDGGWTLVTGSVTVLDRRRPFESLGDPVAVGLVGAALARLGLTHVDQIAGYVRDGAAVPAGWRPADRVLLVVQAQHRLRWAGGAVRDAAGHFRQPAELAPPTRQRRHAVASTVLAGLAPGVRRLLEADHACSVGLTTAVGPVVVPGRWHPGGTMSVDGEALGHLRVRLPGPCAVTVDDDGDGPTRPTSKRGLMLRGEGAQLRPAATAGREVRLVIRVARSTAWAGFDTATSASPGARRVG